MPKTKVEPEERLSKGPVKLDKEALRKQLAKRRKLWRSFVFAFLLLLLYGFWTLAILPNYWISVTKRYDSSGTLEVTVKACDVDFVQSTEPTITHGSLFMGYESRWTNDASDGSLLRSAVLSNSAGCGLMPRMQCRRMCLVTIGVVAGAGTSFQVNQLDGDASWPLVTVTPGTTVDTLNIGAWWLPQATLSLFVDTATISGALGEEDQGQERLARLHGVARSGGFADAYVGVAVRRDAHRPPLQSPPTLPLPYHHTNPLTAGTWRQSR